MRKENDLKDGISPLAIPVISCKFWGVENREKDIHADSNW
jgi:hypothetical protein